MEITNSSIYAILMNDRVLYVGQATKFVNRKHHHLTMLRKGKHANIHLQRLYDKYGEFRFELLERGIDRAKASRRERYWIERLVPECNMVRVFDEDSWLFSESRNKAISDALTGKAKSKEHVKNISISKTGELNPMWGKKPPNQKVITFKGFSMNISEWARHIGIDRKSLEGRFKRGWTIEKALTTSKVLR